jgi:hypothetical protein
VSDAERRTGINESIFRDINERIQDLSDQLDTHEAEFICECADRSCTAHLTLPLRDYEAVRAYPDRFVLIAGHQRADAERVVEDHDVYLVVEKLGEAGEVAEETDPR